MRTVTHVEALVARAKLEADDLRAHLDMALRDELKSTWLVIGLTRRASERATKLGCVLQELADARLEGGGS